jgi:hypothetical protein
VPSVPDRSSESPTEKFAVLHHGSKQTDPLGVFPVEGDDAQQRAALMSQLLPVLLDDWRRMSLEDLREIEKFMQERNVKSIPIRHAGPRRSRR